MSYKLSKRSLDRLEGVHPDIVAVIKRAIEITPIDFTVLEGLRSKDRQAELYASGASKTMNSRHLTGHAVDIAPLDDGGVSWAWPHYYPLAKAVKRAAAELGVAIEWGGDWRSFKDGPHWQLPWDKYSKTDMTPRNSGADLSPVAVDPEPANSEYHGHASHPRETVDDTMTALLAKVQGWFSSGGAAALAGLAWMRDLDPMVQLALIGIVGALVVAGVWSISALIRRERLKHFNAGVR